MIVVPVRLSPRPSRYPMTSQLVSVTYPGELTFSLAPRDPKRVDHDENRGLGTRQQFPHSPPQITFQKRLGWRRLELTMTTDIQPKRMQHMAPVGNR